MKKIIIFSGLFLLLLLPACKKNQPVMDQPAEDGNYHYRNKELKFSLVLPPEFIYYQVQSKTQEGFKDIEFFVPTNDATYLQEVPSYAKPLVIRVFDKYFWQTTQDDEHGSVYQKLEEKNKKVYTYRFWNNPPADWSEKWSVEFGQKIMESFKAL